MSNPHKLQVGQQLWFVYNSNRRGQPHYVEVKRVGRVWAEISQHYRGRISLETLAVDGGDYTSPGQCYLSREQYEAERALESEWRELRKSFDYMQRVPDGMNIEKITKINDILRGLV